MPGWLKLPKREELEANRYLRPFARHLSSPLVWRFNRRGVARGTALGLFAGFAVPMAQTPFAAVFAVAARANLPVAAAATFITNPLTMPFIWVMAFIVGKQAIGMQNDTLFRLAPGAGRLEQAIGWTVNLAGPTYVGLLIFAVVGAAAGWMSVHLGWRLWVGQRWNRRKRIRAARDGQPAGLGAGRT
ncbi:DUF2062 domain-containing protein [Sandaracinobacter neustonicus]|uniref:DUF2062 domain-containing protein n=1 Tax=Sandaracinobacter neustonicus TaxID=1715348 RepID=UPI001F1F7694|nr:DUF2062 domain-containing protein [Sandaracinobacter neustonicus]